MSEFSKEAVMIIDNQWSRIKELEQQNQRYREALEAIADDVEEWEMAGVAMTALEAE